MTSRAPPWRSVRVCRLLCRLTSAACRMGGMGAVQVTGSGIRADDAIRLVLQRVIADPRVLQIAGIGG